MAAAPFAIGIRFWGVRGSIPVPGPATSGFGGNTPCVEVTTPGARDGVLIDAGSGIRAYGRDLLGRDQHPRVIHLFLSHLHWDHIQGLPFFGPLFDREHTVNVYSTLEVERLAQALAAQTSPPFSPIAPEFVAAEVRCQRLPPEGVTLEELNVAPFPLRHPQGCSGFRLESRSRVVVYASDFESGDPRSDRILEEHCAGADLLICDAQYTDEEEPRHRGWGHTTWRAATGIARRAGVARLVLFHHDPSRSDRELTAIVAAARDRFRATQAAREGDLIQV